MPVSAKIACTERWLPNPVVCAVQARRAHTFRGRGCHHTDFGEVKREAGESLTQRQTQRAGQGHEPRSNLKAAHLTTSPNCFPRGRESPNPVEITSLLFNNTNTSKQLHLHNSKKGHVESSPFPARGEKSGVGKGRTRLTAEYPEMQGPRVKEWNSSALKAAGPKHFIPKTAQNRPSKLQRRSQQAADTS